MKGEPVKQFVVPDRLIPKVLELLHDNAGHQGIERTVNLISRRFYWPDITGCVKSYCSKCERCQGANTELPRLKPKMGHITAKRPNEMLCMDFLTLDKASNGQENALVLTDVFSKFTKAYATPNQTALTTAKVLMEHWFLNYGIPKRLHSDKGRNFESQVIQQLCQLCDIKKSRTTSYHPQGNGQTERFNRTLISMLKSLPEDEKKKWPSHLKHVTYAYNCTQHSSTGYTPFFLFLGRHPVLPIDNMFQLEDNDADDEDIDEYVKEQKRLLTDAFDRAFKSITKKGDERVRRHEAKGIEEILKPGTRVLLKKRYLGRHKIQDTYDTSYPYEIVGEPDVKEGGTIYKLRSIVGDDVRIVHRTNFKVIEESSSSSDGEEDSSTDEDVLFESVEEENKEKLPRRSSRATKGKHNNPHNLPKSVLNNSQIMDKISGHPNKSNFIGWTIKANHVSVKF